MNTISKAVDTVTRSVYGTQENENVQATSNPTEHMTCDETGATSPPPPFGDHIPTKGPGAAIHRDKPIVTTTNETSKLTEDQPGFKHPSNRDTLRNRRDSGHAEMEDVQQGKEVEDSNTLMHGHEKKDDGIPRAGGDAHLPMEGYSQQQPFGHETHGDGISRTSAIGGNDSTGSVILSSPPQNKDSTSEFPHTDFGSQKGLPREEKTGAIQGDAVRDREQEQLENTRGAQTGKLRNTATTISDESRPVAETPPGHSHMHAEPCSIHDSTAPQKLHTAESGTIHSEDSNLAKGTCTSADPMEAQQEEQKYQDGGRLTHELSRSPDQIGDDSRKHRQADNEIGTSDRERKTEKGEVGMDKRSEEMEKDERKEKTDVEGESGQDNREEKKPEAGHIWIKTTGTAADDGDFDASKAGAGKEADRLLEKAGVHRSLNPKEQQQKEIAAGTKDQKLGHKDKGVGATKREMDSKQHHDSAATTEGGKHHGLHLPKILQHHNNDANSQPQKSGQGTSEGTVSEHKGLGEKIKEKIKLHKE